MNLSRSIGRVFAAATLSVLITMSAATAFPASAEAACFAPKKIGLTFVIDDSGSMSSSDPSQLRADATRIGLQSLPYGTAAAVETFSDDATTIVPPTDLNQTNRASMAATVSNSLFSDGVTEYGKAFDLANTLEAGMLGVDKKAIVFLSDGSPTDGFVGTELSVRTGVPVYTIGFGVADADVLEAIASSSGGAAYYADDTSQIQDAFSDIVSRVACDTRLVNNKVTLAPGQTLTFGFDTEDIEDTFKTLTTWDSGDITVRVRRPDGSFMVDGSELPGESIVYDTNSAQADSDAPPVGHWVLEVTASTENADDVHATIGVWRRSTPKDLRVVIVPGLTQQNEAGIFDAATLQPNCAVSESLAPICARFTESQFPVDIVSSGKRGRTPSGQPATIDSLGDLGGSAKRLAAYVNNLGTKNVVLVGYSRGGLIAREAAALYGASVRGVITLGAPHDGSFWADAALHGGWLGSLGAAGFVFKERDYRAVEAVVDMSTIARRMRNAVMPKLTPRIWVIGGKACPWTNSDCVVSVPSAWGDHANFGRKRSRKWVVDGWNHGNPGDEAISNMALIGAYQLLGTFRVPRSVVSARQGLSISKKKKSTGAKRRSKAVVALPLVRVVKVKPGKRLSTKKGLVSLSSAKPFTVRCGGRIETSADPFAFGHAIPISKRKCAAHPKVLSASAKVFGTFKSAHRPKVTWRYSRGKTRLIIRSGRRIKSVEFFRAKVVKRCTPRRCTIRFKAKPKSGSKMSVRAGRYTYYSVLPRV